MTAAKGTLYLIPVSLGETDATNVLPQATLAVVHRLRRFIVENPKSARRLLKSAAYPLPLRDAHMTTLDEHTPSRELTGLLAPLLEGEDCGLMSEAGCPAVADPGAELVRLAHAHGVRVVPLVGPSAILLALMACGLNGQRFAFHGYLPVESAARGRKLRELEDESGRSGAAQIFMEVPYRNGALLQAVLERCRGDTLLCIAAELTLPGESIATRAISEWKKNPPALDRRPAMFVLWRP